MELFALLETALFADDPAQKCRLTEELWHRWSSGERLTHHAPRPLEAPSYTSRFQSVHPGRLRERNLRTDEGRARLLHALAHIEYCAIDLALDAAYRFAQMPEEYYRDWLEVAGEERQHYGMLCTLLSGYGHTHGDLPVHDSLFEAMTLTLEITERMGIIPRFLEANGLDANIKLEQKLRSQNDPALQPVLEALEIIRRDEIGHVAKGDRWFKYACSQQGLTPDAWFEMIHRHYPLLADKQILAVKERRQAGFSCSELKRMGAQHCP